MVPYSHATYTYLEYCMPIVLSLCQTQKGVTSLTNQVLMPPIIHWEQAERQFPLLLPSGGATISS
jgi:hypothetical protein